MNSSDLAILKTIWRLDDRSKWVIHDVRTIDLKPQKGFADDYFKIENDFGVLTNQPGLIFDNLFTTFGTTEFMLRQSIVPIVAWHDGEEEMRCIGTGFFVSASGLLMTAGHVIRDPIDESYSGTTQIDERSHRLDGTLNYGVLLPVNPAVRNAPFNVSPQMRSARWVMCPFEWMVHWGKPIKSPLFHQAPEFRFDIDIAICKVREFKQVGPFQPLNIGLHRTRVGDRAVAIGYAEMRNIRLNGEDYQPELHVSVGSVTEVHHDNVIERKNTTPGPNFEFSAKIPGKMSGSPVLVGEGILTKGVISRSWQDERHATGCLVASVMQIPLYDGKSISDLMTTGEAGITKVSGFGL